MPAEGVEIEEAFPRLQDSPETAEAESPAAPDGAAESSMPPAIERVLWQLLVGGGSAPEEDSDQ